MSEENTFSSTMEREIKESPNNDDDDGGGGGDGGEEQTNSNSSSLTLSLTPPLSSNKQNKNGNDDDNKSDIDTISEHLSSIEQDRSVGTEFSLVLKNLPSDEDRLSQEQKPQSLENSFVSLNALERFQLGDINNSNSKNNNVKSILEEILNNEQFRSESESKMDEESLDIFADLKLDDCNLLTDYKLGDSNNGNSNNNNNMGENPEFNLINELGSDSFNNYDEINKRVKDFEELIAVKDSTIAALTSELDSFRDMVSNSSSTTNSTEYKQYQEECHNKLVMYHSKLMHKEEMVQKLTESLHQSVLNHNELREQTEHFKTEIAQLQQQLMETTQILRDSKPFINVDNVDNCIDLSKKCNELAQQLSGNQRILFDNLIQAINPLVCNQIQLDTSNLINLDGSTSLLDFNQECLDLSNSLNEQQKLLFDHVMKLFNQQTLNCNREIAELKSVIATGNLEICKDTNALDFNQQCTDLRQVLTGNQLVLFDKVIDALKAHFSKEVCDKTHSCEQEICDLKARIEADNVEHCNEISKLQQLLGEAQSGGLDELKQALGDKHSKEMEELRTYFEKKCADLEKNYSEEVFSQQSRKMSSASSTCSEISSDLIFQQPGPGGDAKIPDYTKKDVLKIRQDLTDIVTIIDRFNTDQTTDLETLNAELKKFDFRSIFKNDLNLIKMELQNKTHAELEILREDYDNRVDDLNVEHERNLKSMTEKYEEEIDELKAISRQIVPTKSSVQEVVSSGEFEIDEVVQSYERRLQEQVALAKIDIISALQAQIQQLAASDSIDEGWPEELLRLKDRFCEKYSMEMAEMQRLHDLEITRLKEEHVKTLNGALERARRRSLRDADSLSKGEIELLKERDNFKKQTLALRNLLGELLKYFTQCEDELNNTLVEELLKVGFDKSITTQLEEQFDSNTNLNLNETQLLKQRVHLAPNFNDLITLIDTESDLDTIDLKGELGSCLEKLRSDANAILALTTTTKSDEITVLSNSGDNKNNNNSKSNPSVDAKLSSLTRQLINETQNRNELVEQLKESRSLVKSLENERGNLESQLELVIEKHRIVEGDLMKAKEKIAELIENGHKEIVSEGYGEDGRKGFKGMVDAIAALNDLQDRSRVLNDNSKHFDADLLHLVEEFSRVSEKIVDEAKRDREDLKQQIEAADKKYKATCKFLEEQAAEREQERDEAQKNIDMLKGQLKDRNKDRASCERISTEVENLEQQLREMSVQLTECDQRFKDADTERTEAIEKIHVLRDIIRDLESQVEVKTRNEDELRSIVHDLEGLVRNQGKYSDDELDKELQRKPGHVSSLEQQIGELESEVQRLRLSTEIAGSEGAIKQIRNHLCDFETTLEKRTKDLETLHSTISTTACSSPSEDMSIRDMVNPVNTSNSIFEECEVPLQQLARLKEKLIKHSRAEDAAIKRIKDLEMQIYNVKNELEEAQGEREILKKDMAEQLVLISSLQIRLDDQRMRAEHIEKQTNTSLEVRIYDLQETVTGLEEQLGKKEKLITELNLAIDETRMKLKERERELGEKKDDQIVIDMQRELEQLRADNLKLKNKIDTDTKNFVENILSDKNSNIEALKEKLACSEKELQFYSNLTLDKSQLQALNKLCLSGVSINDFIEVENEEQCRRVAEASPELGGFKRAINETTLMGISGEISAIEKPEISIFQSLQYGKQNSTEKHVRFEDEERLKELQVQMAKKDELIREFQQKLDTLVELESKVEKLQTSLEETEKILRETTDQFEREQRDLVEGEKSLKLDLAARRLEIDEKDTKIANSSAEIQKLQSEIQNYLTAAAKDESMIKTLTHDLERRICDLNLANEQLKTASINLEILTKTLQTRDDQINNLQNLQSQLNQKSTETLQLHSKLDDHKKEINQLNHLILEKDKVINQMTEDSKSLHINLETIQAKLQESGNIIDLGKKLREEQRKNWELIDEIHSLKAQLLSVERKSIDEITGQVQRELDYSAYLDSTIINAVSEHRTIDINSLRDELKKVQTENRDLIQLKSNLEIKLKESELIIITLQSDLEKTKTILISNQLEDKKLIEQIRTRLDSSITDKEDLEKTLTEQKLERGDLEQEVALLKAQLATFINGGTSSKSESTQYQEITDLQIKNLRKELLTYKEQHNYLNNQIKLLTDSKLELETNFTYIQGLVRVKEDEIGVLQKKIESLKERDRVHGEKVEEFRRQMEQKNAEVEDMRNLYEELDHDRSAMKRQIEMLNQRQKVPNQADSNLQQPLSEGLMAKMKELYNVAKDNREMLNIIARLTNEKSALEERIIELESNTFRQMPFDDPVARANYLFAKYLRAESYRKALVFQKRFLLALLATYQVTEIPKVELPIMKQRPAKKYSFKSIAIVITSVIRIKSLVRRWHTGKRLLQPRSTINLKPTAQFQVGQPVSSQNFTRINLQSQPQQQPSQSQQQQQQQQTQSNQYRASNYSMQPSITINRPEQHTLPYVGDSPPCRDRSFRKSYLGPTEPLATPPLLSQFSERFKQIQDILGVAPMAPTD